MKKNIIFAVCLFIICMTINFTFAAELCIPIPDAKITRALDGICGQYQYDPNTDGTQIHFVKYQMRRFIRESVLAYEWKQSKESISLESFNIDPNAE